MRGEFEIFSNGDSKVYKVKRSKRQWRDAISTEVINPYNRATDLPGRDRATWAMDTGA